LAILYGEIITRTANTNKIAVHPMKVYTGSRDTDPYILNLNTRWRRVISFTHRPLYLERKPIVTIEIGSWVGLRAGLDVSE
jgi:hypothetical protein